MKLTKNDNVTLVMRKPHKFSFSIQSVQTALVMNWIKYIVFAIVTISFEFCVCSSEAVTSFKCAVSSLASSRPFHYLFIVYNC